MSIPIHIRSLGVQPYERIWAEMKSYTDHRNDHSPDEIWLLEHEPVFTLGQSAKTEHWIAPIPLTQSPIPLVYSDRGGQLTYHGPGQLIVYPLIDLKRRHLHLRHLVDALEQSVIRLLRDYGVEGRARADAPGVYVSDAKIASLGLRLRHGRSYHGLSLNVAMDLTPFSWINPCGMSQLAMTQLSEYGVGDSVDEVAEKLMPYLLMHFTLGTQDGV